MTHLENTCYHCQAAIPSGCDISENINDLTRFYCCFGCKAISSTIHQSGLDAFYQYRSSDRANKPDISQQNQDNFLLFDTPGLQSEFVSILSNELHATTLIIEGITCAACIWLIEKHLQQIKGIQNFSVNHTNFHAEIEWNPIKIKISEILSHIAELGYQANPYQEDAAETALLKLRKQSLIRIGIAGIATMQSMMFAIPMYAGAYSGINATYLALFRWVSLIVILPVMFISARPFFESAWRDLRQKHLTMDVPVALAISLAFLASTYVTFFGGTDTYFDSIAMFTFFLLIGRYIEIQARLKSEAGSNALNKLTPKTAIFISSPKEPAPASYALLAEHKVLSDTLKPGDIIKVLPASHFPADGLICEGESSVDESALTGEFLPKTRQAGEFVAAGTLNVENPVFVRVTAIAHNSKLFAITRLIARAQNEKPPVQKIADKVASWFVLFVLGASTITFITWYIIDPGQAFRIALSVLVVTCPCALALATPATFTTATQFLREKGLLISKGHVLSALADSTHIVFDKTGTLTEGKLTLSDTYTFEESNSTTPFEIASSLESSASHPIARLFNNPGEIKAQNIKNHIGEGVEGIINHQPFRVGKASFCTRILPEEKKKQTDINIPALKEGHWIFLCNNQSLLAAFKIEDNIRPSAQTTIEALKALHIESELLSGDISDSVPTTAKTLSIEKYQSGMSPDGKLDYITQEQDSGKKLVMVGDGINDVLVMASARVSIAMGNASELTRLKADMLLMGDDLTKIPLAIKTAKKTKKIIIQNLSWAVVYNLTALPLAASGHIPPWGAALGMSLSSLIVVMNALRLRKI